jgi:hypothetical protein
MARTHHTARKSTNRLPVGQLATQNVPCPQESQPDAPQHASQEEEPFVIELVVPESPMAQVSPVGEQQQAEDHDVEDKTDKDSPVDQVHGFFLSKNNSRKSNFPIFSGNLQKSP